MSVSESFSKMEIMLDAYGVGLTAMQKLIVAFAKEIPDVRVRVQFLEEMQAIIGKIREDGFLWAK